jgi:glutamyl-tRNA(Gln) amidotransferase subunit D
MSYQGKARKFLESASIDVGDMVRVEKPDVTYDGMVLDRADDADDRHIVLKLENGYNIGVEISDARIELIEKGSKPKIELPPVEVSEDPELPDVSIISTGGTVASIIDYRTGAVHPAFTADDLLRANPELLDIANIRGRAVFNILSENMKPEYWVETARAVYSEIKDGADGVVVAHGTDTMHYTSAALSFMLRTPVPVVFTGAQRSSDRPSSDANLNIQCSVRAAASEIAEVTVCMHATMDDLSCHLHRGVKVRKMHTSRRDTFRSINALPLAKVTPDGLKILQENYRERGSDELELSESVEERVAFIKSYPGITPEIIKWHLNEGYRGIVIEGTGLGHCPDTLIPVIGEARDIGVPVAMTSQCLNGRVNMNVYSTGRRLLQAGVIPCDDMLPEVAYVKMCWVLGQTDDPETAGEMMRENIAGEINERTSIAYFRG